MCSYKYRDKLLLSANMDFTEPTKSESSADEGQLKKAEKAKSNQDDCDKGNLHSFFQFL